MAHPTRCGRWPTEAASSSSRSAIAVVGKATFEPGWRWTEHVKPIVGTESCEVPHLVYLLSGHQKVLMDDGTELDIGPGEVVAIPPGTTAG